MKREIGHSYRGIPNNQISVHFSKLHCTRQRASYKTRGYLFQRKVKSLFLNFQIFTRNLNHLRKKIEKKVRWVSIQEKMKIKSKKHDSFTVQYIPALLLTFMCFLPQTM